MIFYGRFTDKARKALVEAQEEVKKSGGMVLGSEHLLLGIMRDPGKAGIVLQNVDREVILAEIRKMQEENEEQEEEHRQLVVATELREVLTMSVKAAEELGQRETDTHHMLLSMLRTSTCTAAKLLDAAGLNRDDAIEAILKTYGSAMNQIPIMGEQEAEVSNNKKTKTPMLDRYSKDLTELAEAGKLDTIIGRKTELERVIQILCRRRKNNPILLGEPGVGKSSIVEGLAQLIAKKEAPKQLEGKRLVQLDITSMLAGAKYRGEFEERIKGAVDEVAKEGNVILFIDEIHTIVGAGAGESSIDAASMLKPMLARGELHCIGATTYNEYHKYIEKDGALVRRFQTVMVDEPTDDETIDILKGIRPEYEKHHNLKITDEALKAAVDYSKRYIPSRKLPDKAIDIIDEAASKSNIEAGKNGITEGVVIGDDEVASVVSMWTGVPVTRMNESEAQKLLHLEETLHGRIIGQDEAVSSVAKAVRRSRAGLRDPKRPIGSFIFLGPTGVGKTELCKVLSTTLFGDDSSLIRIDMSEYMEKHTVSRLVGSPPGYVGFDDGGQLTEMVSRKPYSIILFDEIEKAHPDVFNMLLQILEDGRLTDGKGKVVDFKNTIIVMTSNAGASLIKKQHSMGFATSGNEKQDYEGMKNVVMSEVKRIFRPEFINRVDDIIVFHALEFNDIRKIAALLLSDVSERLTQHGITLTVGEDVLDMLAEEGFDSTYGARPLRRIIQNKIEDLLSDELLSNHIVSGDSVQLILCNGEVAITHQIEQIPCND